MTDDINYMKALHEKHRKGGGIDQALAAIDYAMQETYGIKADMNRPYINNLADKDNPFFNTAPDTVEP